MNQTNSGNALSGAKVPTKLPMLQRDKLPLRMRPEIAFAKNDEDLRCCVVCMRVTSKGRRVKRIVLINSRNLSVTDEDGICRRNIYCRGIEKAFSNVEGTKTLLFKIKGEEDLLLQEIASEAGKNSNFASILDVLDKVREANGGSPVPRTRSINTGREVVANSTKDDRRKKERPSIRSQIEAAKDKAKTELQEAQEVAKVRQITQPRSPSALSSPRSPLQYGIKPPPPSGPPPGLRQSQGGSLQPSQVNSFSPAQLDPLDATGVSRPPDVPSEDLKKLTSYIEQLQAERELVDMQLDARKRELSTLTEYSQRMQDQLTQQQENANTQQQQFNEYIHNAQHQYQEYIEALYMQHKRASEQRAEFQEMYQKQNDEIWKQIASQVEEDEGSDEDDVDDVRDMQSPSPRGVALRGQPKKITVKVEDGDVCSFSVDESFWDEMCAQIQTVVGFSEHPLCAVSRGDDFPLQVNRDYLAYFASAWCQREPYCVSTWNNGQWSFTDAQQYWNRRPAHNPHSSDNEPPPLDYVPKTRSNKSPKYKGRF